MTFCRLFAGIGVLDIPLVFFVDGVVGEVSIFRVFSRFWVVVRLACKTRQSLVVHIYAERLETCHQNIHSQVELQTVEKQRVVNVA